MKRLMFSLFIAMGLAGCGLFTPRTDFEDPASEGGTVDHFRFASLLEGSGEKFSKLDWYELFDDHFKYINVRLANVEYDKTALISHLFQQHEIYPQAVVKWSNTDGFLRNIDTITLSNAGYTVESGDDIFSGTSSFTIIRDAVNIWHIVSWTDEPATDPFFSPAE